MSNQEPAQLIEQNHGVENELLARELFSMLCDEIVAEGVVVVAAVRKALAAEGVDETLAYAFTDKNPAAREAGIELFLRSVGICIKADVEAEGSRRMDAIAAKDPE